MKISMKSKKLILLIFLLITICTSCSNIALEGYGVVLWGGGQFSLSPGILVKVHSQSTLDNTFTISTLQDNLEYTVKKGFIEKFDSKKKALLFKKRYIQYQDTYAAAAVSELRIRENPGIDGSIGYKLHKGDEVKIVDKVKISDQSEAYTGIWYRVVTTDGYKGFSNGKYLTLRTGEEDIEHTAVVVKYTELQDQFLSSKWRPDYMKRMLAQNRIDLERLDPHIGLFPLEDKKEIHIKTIKSSYTFSFDTPKVSSSKTLIFSGGDLRVQFINENNIMVEYEAHGSLVREQYVKLDVAVEETIEAEEERRKKKYKKFLEKGTTYVSSQYGILHFRDNFAVTWKWREATIEHILPAEAGKEGRLEFDVILAKELQNAYSGAFSLVFPFADREHEITFVYDRTQNGLQLIYIPENLIVKNEITSLPPSSKLIMYFHNQNT